MGLFDQVFTPSRGGSLKLIFTNYTKYFNFTASFIFLNFSDFVTFGLGGGDERWVSHAFLTSSIFYQWYLVKGSVRMQWHRSGFIATWEFYDVHWKEEWSWRPNLKKKKKQYSEGERYWEKVGEMSTEQIGK